VIKKRLIGVVTVKDGWAVQSIGYRRYLPLGRPEVLVENLDRWGADEILLQCIDRTRQGLGPDFDVLARVGRRGISTPLVYCGGIRTVDDGVAAIKAGGDRICVDSILHDNPQLAVDLAKVLGSQAIVASLPVSCDGKSLEWLDYRSGKRNQFAASLLDVLRSGAISEALLIDWRHEGVRDGFDMNLLSLFPVSELALICFGGLSEVEQLRVVLDNKQVAAAAVGNFLSYREHAVQRLKASLAGLPLRRASYERTHWA
jgi:imidazole glycerol-phosphate synthase subunit HisF